MNHAALERTFSDHSVRFGAGAPGASAVTSGAEINAHTERGRSTPRARSGGYEHPSPQFPVIRRGERKPDHASQRSLLFGAPFTSVRRRQGNAARSSPHRGEGALWLATVVRSWNVGCSWLPDRARVAPSPLGARAPRRGSSTSLRRGSSRSWWRPVQGRSRTRAVSLNSAVSGRRRRGGPAPDRAERALASSRVSAAY
jgi:hypothetical protein